MVPDAATRYALQMLEAVYESVGENPDMAAMAFSPDELVEAVYMRDKRFVWAVQWHPEYLYKKDHDASAIFEAFISSCSASKTQF